MRVVFRSEFNAEELQCYVREGKDRVRRVAAGEGDILSKRGFTKERLLSGNGCATSGFAFHKKNVCSDLQKQMSMCRPEMFVCNSHEVPRRVGHSFATEWRPIMRKRGGTSDEVLGK